MCRKALFTDVFVMNKRENSLLSFIASTAHCAPTHEQHHLHRHRARLARLGPRPLAKPVGRAAGGCGAGAARRLDHAVPCGLGGVHRPQHSGAGGAGGGGGAQPGLHRHGPPAARGGSAHCRCLAGGAGRPGTPLGAERLRAGAVPKAALPQRAGGEFQRPFLSGAPGRRLRPRLGAANLFACRMPGNINLESGHGEWPLGMALLQSLLGESPAQRRPDNAHNPDPHSADSYQTL